MILIDIDWHQVAQLYSHRHSLTSKSAGNAPLSITWAPLFGSTYVEPRIFMVIPAYLTSSPSYMEYCYFWLQFVRKLVLVRRNYGANAALAQPEHNLSLTRAGFCVCVAHTYVNLNTTYKVRTNTYRMGRCYSSIRDFSWLLKMPKKFISAKPMQFCVHITLMA